MRPEDYIDENYVPTEEDFAPEKEAVKVDEKEELRKYIRKNYRYRSIVYMILAIMFFIEAIYRFHWVRSPEAFDYGLSVMFLLCGLGMMYQVIVHYRVCRSATAVEMQHHLNKLANDSVSTRIALVFLSLSFVTLAVLSLMDKCRWYVILLVALGVLGLTFGFWWVILKLSQDVSADADVKELMLLEQGDAETSVSHE